MPAKHAYLIMAHNEFGLLKKLLTLLDHPRNDIFLHVDSKAREFNPLEYNDIVKTSELFFCDRTNVTWGGYSQIKCELILLKAATQKYHDYYHLISGVDLPLKSQENIHAFFDQHQGTEFISLDQRLFAENFSERIQYYYFFQEILGRPQKSKSVINQINKTLLKTQQMLHVNRIKNCATDFKKGANWFNITHELAQYILSQEDNIKRNYRYTKAADEIFLATIAWNTLFRDRICEKPLRYTDWKRGQPYIFREEDFEIIINSDAFWARKFSEEKDSIITNRILQYFST